MRRQRLFGLLRSTTVALAKRRPTVLVVEDVHWSDRITRDALLYLTALAREGRWVVVVTYRDDELSARPAVREFLDALNHDALLHIELDALSSQDVAALMEGIAGERPTQQDAERVHRRSGGVPLLVEEVVAAQAAGMTGVPDHLRDLFLARLHSVGEPAVRAARVVAAMGDRCDERLVADALGISADKVATALDRAVSAEILITDGAGYRMRHELLGEAVYSAIPAGERRRLHRRIAESLSEAKRLDVVALARHWYDAHEPAQAALANLDAATLAERLHASGEAFTYLQRVLEHFDALPANRATAVGGLTGLLDWAAEAAHRSGAHARAIALVKESLNVADEPAAMAVRWERLGLYCWVSRNGAGARQAYEMSVAVLPGDAPAEVRARVLSGYAGYLMMANRMVEAQGWSQRALEAADESGEPLEQCRALRAWGYTHADDDQGLTALWKARDLAIVCDAGEELARIHAALNQSLRRQGRTAEREQVLRDGISYAAAMGLRNSFWPAMNYFLAELFMDIGRWDEADEILQGLGERGLAGIHAMFTNAYRARLAAARGDAATAIRCADRVAALAEELPDQPIPQTIAWCAHAESCLWSGKADEAMSYVDQAIALTTSPMSRAEAVTIRARAAADLAERARRRGQVGADLVTDARAWAATERRPQVRALVATTRAEVSRYDGNRDPDPWRGAVAAWDAAGDPYRAAYCRWRLAYALLGSRSGRRAAARELSAARRTADQLGARPLLESSDRLAARARIGPQDTESGGDGTWAATAELGLTQRELEVLPLLMAGRTNAEIADALVISPRTVGVHVSRILQKLGAARRTEAADIARRRGLVAD
jgi:DNA-binding CsgD family transcriptional regulator/tetratricopeptide (TPR) repeat protein